MTRVTENRWMSAKEECALHIERLQHARQRTSALFPLSQDRYRQLTDDDISFLDQYVYRFIKLQDCMGENLFPFSLSLLGEDMSTKPFIDILNRMERLGVISSATSWISLRELRNDLTHEYPDNEDERRTALQNLAKAADEIMAAYQACVRLVEDRREKWHVADR